MAPSTAYTFTVKAKNAEGTLSGPSAPVSVTTTATTDRVTIGTARWKAGDFRVGGTGSVNGNTVQIYRANADGTISTQTIGTPTADHGERVRHPAPHRRRPGDQPGPHLHQVQRRWRGRTVHRDERLIPPARPEGPVAAGDGALGVQRVKKCERIAQGIAVPQ